MAKGARVQLLDDVGERKALLDLHRRQPGEHVQEALVEQRLHRSTQTSEALSVSFLVIFFGCLV